MTRVLICLFFVCAFSMSAIAEEQNSKHTTDSIFNEKLILCEIDFLPDSYTLSVQAKSSLDSVLGELEKIDTRSKVIRIEGFSGGQDTVSDSTQLSMLRALAIEDYLRIKHSAEFERFLTGHNVTTADCRAQIAVYDNPWQDVSDAVHVTNRGELDGPS